MWFAILLLWNMVSQNMIIHANKDEDLKPAAQERMMMRESKNPSPPFHSIISPIFSPASLGKHKVGDGIPPACLGSLSPPPPHHQEDTREGSKLPIKLHWAFDIKDSLSLWRRSFCSRDLTSGSLRATTDAYGGRRWSALLDYQSNPFWSTGRRIAIVCNLQRDWTSRGLIPGSRPELKASAWFKIFRGDFFVSQGFFKQRMEGRWLMDF